LAPPILKLDNIYLSFGGAPLLAGVNMQIEPGDRVCLVGRNGSGKSTLLKMAAGLAEPQNGEVYRHPSSTVRYLNQAPDFEGFSTVEAYAAAGLGPSDDPYRVTYLLEHLGLSGDQDPESLSGGEARRAALARVLAPEPDILLLDEPTNHLDLPTIEWLEGELVKSRSALIVISHDRRFLEKVSTATIWLDRGVARRLDQGFGHFEAWRDKVLEEEEIEQHKLGKQIEREEHWLRYGVTAGASATCAGSASYRTCARSTVPTKARWAVPKRPFRRLANPVSWWSRRTGSPRPLATGPSSRRSRSGCIAAIGSVLSGRMAPARPPFSRC